MKRFVVMLLVLTAFPVFAAAQSLEKALEQLESARALKGEQSEEYLSALDSVIQYSSLTDALSFRKEHLNIIRQMKGDECVEVADDLWRLGNVSNALEDSIKGLDYYKQAARAFDNVIDCKNNAICYRCFAYCLISIIKTCVTLQDSLGVNEYSKKLFMLCSSTGLESCEYLELLDDCSYYNYKVGNSGNTLYYCNEAIESCAVIDSCNYKYVDAAYYYVRSYYYKSRQDDLVKSNIIQYLNLLNASEEVFTNEKVACLLYALVSDVFAAEEALEYGKKAEQLLLESCSVQNELFSDERYYVAILGIASQLDALGRYMDELPYRILCCDVLKYNGETNTKRYFKALLELVNCQMVLANYSDAINTLDSTMHLVKDQYGEDNDLYSDCLKYYASYYQTIGAYDEAVRYSESAVEVNKTVFGENSYRYISALGNTAELYLALNMPELSYQLLSDALDNVFEVDEENNNYLPPDVFCQMSTLLSKTMFELGRYEEGWEYFMPAMNVSVSFYGAQSREVAKYIYDIGEEMLYYEEGVGSVSFDYFLIAAGVLYALGQTDDPLLLNSLFDCGATGIISGKLFESDDLVSRIPMEFESIVPSCKHIETEFAPLTYMAIKKYYYDNLAYYSSNERDYAWYSLSDILNLVFDVAMNSNTNQNLYDCLLFSKSLMLSTSDNFKSAVYNTGQKDLIGQYNNIQAVQRILDNQNFGLIEKQSHEQLYERKTSMERKLIAEMKALGYSVNDSIIYDDVRNALKDREIAIEFVDYYHLKDQNTYYVAFLAKSSWDKPVCVQLCTEDELKACLGNPNVTYSTDDLYRLLWQPLLEYVGDSCTVYFSPSGMLHTIALESIHTPDGSCLSDKYNLVRLTSTRELCKAKQPKTYETGAIYGGLQYDVEQQRMAEVAAMNKTEYVESPAFALRGEDRGNWNYLQGTKDEAEHIACIMRQANIGCNLYEGDLGSEESFKALSGGNTDIIHLATHGYFLEGEKADMNDFMKSLSPLARQKTDSVIDPLLRSGLILSGGNSAWLGKEVPEGIEDGVLTALEISTMNLLGTDIVVMSACETGLGDITSDGVFGLQRAFKMAGVQTLVMSLWKVDDNATSLMMQTFYEHLLSGLSKRDAFNLAQAAVREKYTEPYYWAGFIMLD